MAILLGIDTGGTFTDAVIYDDASGAVLAKAKSPTTHGDLAHGIRAAIEQVFSTSDVASAIEMIGVSTTLATNALVEGQGQPAALIFVGFKESDLGRIDMRSVLDERAVIAVNGGHTVHGSEAMPLDLDGLEVKIGEIEETVSAYAVVSQFAVRNSAHEIAARNLIREITSKPVTCSHELTSKLGGPQRALTTVLNARLISLIDQLIASISLLAEEFCPGVPIMVVRCDGTLMSAESAKTRPIETILSGPAASVVGAAHLADAADAFVSDIGGTTTDIAVLTGGRPRLNPEGARVGGWQTLVEAIDIETHGLGGDSRVSIQHEGTKPRLVLGPQRAIPLAVFSDRFGSKVLNVLDKQLRRSRTDDRDAQFVVLNPAVKINTGAPETAIIEKLAEGWSSLEALTPTRRERAIVDRLLAAGALRLATFTPTDASILTGSYDAHGRAASERGASLFARMKDRVGNPIASDASAFARWVIDALVKSSAEKLRSVALAADGFKPENIPEVVLEAALAGHRGKTTLNLALNAPVVGVGASAGAYYPRIADTLNTGAIVPEDADVANALGAVVGRVSVRRTKTLVPNDAGAFEIDGSGNSFKNAKRALEAAESLFKAALREEAEAMGAVDPSVHVTAEAVEVDVEGRTMAIELKLIGEAYGRPRTISA
ncbi:MAG: hydantoinase/oxoprolinase family protein [Pseudomonadota bacterium]